MCSEIFRDFSIPILHLSFLGLVNWIAHDNIQQFNENDPDPDFGAWIVLAPIFGALAVLFYFASW